MQTEQDSTHRHLEKKSTLELLKGINQEDKTVAVAVEKIIPKIQNFVDHCYERMELGGRLFYVGAGTSGRLGIVDASECPPTFGVDHNLVIGIMAGGDNAIRRAVEFAEDDDKQAWIDLKKFDVNPLDTVVGIAASGKTPYVVGAIQDSRNARLLTGCICCNSSSDLAAASEYPMEVITGPEFLTGSTRMKAGTAQKLVLNMISTSLMIKLGRVKDNKMVDMQLSNNKLVARGTKMVMDARGLTAENAQKLLIKHKSVRNAINAMQS